MPGRRLTFPAEGGSVPRGRTRPLVPLPDLAALPARTRATLDRADAVAAQLAERCRRRGDAGLDRVLPRPDRFWPNIHHPLTPLFAPVETAIALTAARDERTILRAHAARLGPVPAGDTGIAFAAAVPAIAHDLTGSAALRAQDVCARPDRFGRYVVYPDPSLIGGRLEAIGRFLAGAGGARAFAATVALVAVTNCHPLLDGNGRLARIVANARLFEDAGAAAYVPWREIALFARGGYILRVREAEIHGDWHPLATFVLAALTWWADLVPARSGRDAVELEACS